MTARRKGPARRAWTAAEDTAIRRRYPHEKTAALAADLGRSLTSTYQRARNLGLAKTAAYLASPAACRAAPGRRRGPRDRPGRPLPPRPRPGEQGPPAPRLDGRADGRDPVPARHSTRRCRAQLASGRDQVEVQFLEATGSLGTGFIPNTRDDKALPAAGKPALVSSGRR